VVVFVSDSPSVLFLVWLSSVCCSCSSSACGVFAFLLPVFPMGVGACSPLVCVFVCPFSRHCLFSSDLFSDIPFTAKWFVFRSVGVVGSVGVLMAGVCVCPCCCLGVLLSSVVGSRLGGWRPARIIISLHWGS